MEKELSICIANVSNFPKNYSAGNISPINLVKQSGYPKLFSHVTSELISKYLRENPDLIDIWLQYSEDIRHGPAWGFGPKDDKWLVAYYDSAQPIKQFIYNDKFEACAQMVKMTIEEIRVRSL